MKTIPRVLFLVVLAGFFCMTLFAQQDSGTMAKPKAAGDKKQAPAGMPMVKPAPEMTKLINPRARWAASRDSAPGGGTPRPSSFMGYGVTT
jgi:hypothetical protein